MDTALQFLISCYQRVLSPLVGGCCRFTPSCSEYARQSIRQHGACKGLLLACCRVLRCNPLCRGGVDPVPDDFSLRGLIRKSTTLQGESEA
ncbi:MAG: membrane protein insertion efficiency factor YidD [Desulfohalobiaceae bacterium]